jgi:hypothetical protein
MAVALNVSRDCLYEWGRVHSAFSDALAQARELSLAWWEAQGQRGIWEAREFNAQAYKFMISNRFPDEYRERTEVGIKGIVGSLDLSRLTDEQLARISGGENVLAVLATSVPALGPGPKDPSPVSEP